MGGGVFVTCTTKLKYPKWRQFHYSWAAATHRFHTLTSPQGSIKKKVTLIVWLIICMRRVYLYIFCRLIWCTAVSRTRGIGLTRLSLPIASSKSWHESPHRRLLMVRTQSTTTLTFIPDYRQEEKYQQVSFLTTTFICIQSLYMTASWKQSAYERHSCSTGWSFFTDLRSQ